MSVAMAIEGDKGDGAEGFTEEDMDLVVSCRSACVKRSWSVKVLTDLAGLVRV
ncbi:MAG: hypothetical protein AAFU58_05735 [Pseudomonadota bacterium]